MPTPGDTAFTVAVKITVWPKTEPCWGADEETVVVVARELTVKTCLLLMEPRYPGAAVDRLDRVRVGRGTAGQVQLLVLAMPFATGTVTGLPMMLMPLGIVNITLPWLTLVAPLVTLAVRVTGWSAALKMADVLTATTAAGTPALGWRSTGSGCRPRSGE